MRFDPRSWGSALDRTLEIDQVKRAAAGVVTAALLAEGWSEALASLARAAGACHAVLMRNAPHGVVTCVSNEEASEGIASYMAGRAPPNSRYAKVDTRRASAFRVDYDDYTSEELADDPYYQDFLRPMGIFWHGNAVLSADNGEYVELSLKRNIDLGPYRREDVVILNTALADLRAASRIAKSTLDAEVRGMTWLLRKRGELVIEIDSWGRVLPGQWPGEADPSSPLRVSGRRLVATENAMQPLLDRAVATAISRSTGRVALVPLVGADGGRYLLQVQPVHGVARDVFLSAQAIAVLIERDRDTALLNADKAAIRDAFGLTNREADVTVLLCEGLGITAIAARLGIRPETARTYLRDVLDKTGARRQGEIVALLRRL
jgi:DNA-binding CsgD family transcriptional regulator